MPYKHHYGGYKRRRGMKHHNGGHRAYGFKKSKPEYEGKVAVAPQKVPLHKFSVQLVTGDNQLPNVGLDQAGTQYDYSSSWALVYPLDQLPTVEVSEIDGTTINSYVGDQTPGIPPGMVIGMDAIPLPLTTSQARNNCVAIGPGQLKQADPPVANQYNIVQDNVKTVIPDQYEVIKIDHYSIRSKFVDMRTVTTQVGAAVPYPGAGELKEESLRNVHLRDTVRDNPQIYPVFGSARLISNDGTLDIVMQGASIPSDCTIDNGDGLIAIDAKSIFTYPHNNPVDTFTYRYTIDSVLYSDPIQVWWHSSYVGNQGNSLFTADNGAQFGQVEYPVGLLRIRFDNVQQSDQIYGWLADVTVEVAVMYYGDQAQFNGGTPSLTPFTAGGNVHLQAYICANGGYSYNLPFQSFIGVDQTQADVAIDFGPDIIKSFYEACSYIDVGLGVLGNAAFFNAANNDFVERVCFHNATDDVGRPLDWQHAYIMTRCIGPSAGGAVANPLFMFLDVVPSTNVVTPQAWDPYLNNCKVSLVYANVSEWASAAPQDEPNQGVTFAAQLAQLLNCSNISTLDEVVVGGTANPNYITLEYPLIGSEVAWYYFNAYKNAEGLCPSGMYFTYQGANLNASDDSGTTPACLSYFGGSKVWPVGQDRSIQNDDTNMATDPPSLCAVPNGGLPLTSQRMPIEINCDRPFFSTTGFQSLQTGEVGSFILGYMYMQFTLLPQPQVPTPPWCGHWDPSINEGQGGGNLNYSFKFHFVFFDYDNEQQYGNEQVQKREYISPVTHNLQVYEKDGTRIIRNIQWGNDESGFNVFLTPDQQAEVKPWDYMGQEFDLVFRQWWADIGVGLPLPNDAGDLLFQYYDVPGVSYDIMNMYVASSLNAYYLTPITKQRQYGDFCGVFHLTNWNINFEPAGQDRTRLRLVVNPKYYGDRLNKKKWCGWLNSNNSAWFNEAPLYIPPQPGPQPGPSPSSAGGQNAIFEPATVRLVVFETGERLCWGTDAAVATLPNVPNTALAAVPGGSVAMNLDFFGPTRMPASYILKDAVKDMKLPSNVSAFCDNVLTPPAPGVPPALPFDIANIVDTSAEVPLHPKFHKLYDETKKTTGYNNIVEFNVEVKDKKTIYYQTDIQLQNRFEREELPLPGVVRAAPYKQLMFPSCQKYLYCAFMFFSPKPTAGAAGGTTYARNWIGATRFSCAYTV